MKFKSSNEGWRECIVSDAPDSLSINIPARDEQDATPYIEALTAGDPYGVCVALSRKQLRKLAYKILKELGK